MTRDVDLRMNARRAKAYYLFMSGKTKADIAEELKVGESTIDRDLEAVRREIAFDEIATTEPVNWDNVRKEALDSLRMVKTMLLTTYNESEGKPWTQARILAIMKDIDVRILERVAQPPQTKIDIKMIRQDALMIASFLTEKHKELLPDFKDFIRQAKIKTLEKAGSERQQVTEQYKETND